MRAFFQAGGRAHCGNFLLHFNPDREIGDEGSGCNRHRAGSGVRSQCGEDGAGDDKKEG